MFKKLSLISVLCISLVGLFGAQATAYPPGLGGVWWCPWCPGSEPPAVIVTSEFVGISNEDKNPSDVYIWMLIESGELRSLNPGGQDGGLPGIPFFDIPVPMLSTSTGEAPMKGRGKWEGKFIWYHSELIEIIFDWLENNDPDFKRPKLPNDGWSWQLRIYQALIRVTGNTDASGICELNDPYPAGSPVYPDYPIDPEEQCTEPLHDPNDPTPPPAETLFEEVVHNISRCYAVTDDDGNIIFGEYDSCDRLFLWKYKSKSQLCEYEDPNRDDQPCVYEFPFDPENWWDYVPYW